MIDLKHYMKGLVEDPITLHLPRTTSREVSQEAVRIDLWRPKELVALIP